MMNKISNEIISKKFNYEGLKSIAVILMQLNEKHVDKVMNMLDIEEVQSICFVMSELGRVPRSFIDISVKNFILKLRQSTKVGDMKMVKNLISNLTIERQESILKGINNTVWNDIAALDEENLFKFLKGERPTIVAIILSKLTVDIATNFITSENEDRALDIILALSNIEKIESDVLEQVEDSLKDSLGKMKGSMSQRILIDIFNTMNVDKEQSLTVKIKSVNPDLSEFIKSHIFKFDNIDRLRKQDMQTLINQINKEDLKFALQKSSIEMVNLFLGNMSERASRIIKDDIAMIANTVDEEEINNARTAISSVARSLIKSGDIKVVM